jgi:hypothetical protein
MTDSASMFHLQLTGCAPWRMLCVCAGSEGVRSGISKPQAAAQIGGCQGGGQKVDEVLTTPS